MSEVQPTSAPRVRFSPAPTGYLHVGGARSALFNWIYARGTGGTMLLRIEDTDADRSKPELTEAIYDALSWLGIDWDEEPVHQSDRFDLYREKAQGLLENGLAYRCDCSQEEVQARAKERGGPPGYDGHCRDRGLTGDGTVVRFRTPDEGVVSWPDVIRGDVEFQCAELEDFVVVRSSGVPMFLVANAVDDAEMNISHVIRGEDLVNTTPKVMLLRKALGYDHEPIYAHLPLIVNEQRKKLSKRRDDVNVADYRDRGFLPEAMANYLALLGWGPPDDVEVRPMSEIIEKFELSDVVSSPAAFDIKKLTHFNETWIRGLETDNFLERVQPWVTGETPWPADAFNEATFAKLGPLMQERTKTLDMVPEYVDWAFLADAPEDEKSWTKAMVKYESASEVLDASIDRLDGLEWTTEALYGFGDAIAEQFADSKKREVFGVVRVAVMGRTVGLPLWESLEALGHDESLRRLRAAQQRMAES